MKTGVWWTIIGVLCAVIVVLTWILFTTPAPEKNGGGNVAPSTSSTSTGPLHERVVVNAPVLGETVGKTFTVTGEAPGNWYFEASFPVQVRDLDNNKVGQGIAQAQSDWMTTEQVSFKAAVTVAGYSGSATLVLLRDNPSGLPENDDSLSIPIVIQ
jgi:hypothetical protein